MTADESEAIASQLSRARRTDEKNHIASCLVQPATKVTTHRTGADDKAVVGGAKLPTTRRLWPERAASIGTLSLTRERASILT
jgi:hypothetical protein